MESTVLHIDTAKDLGPVRRLNSVGGGPVTYSFSYDASAYFKEAKIPFSRTHDIEYPFGSGEYVDVHNLFPDFDKDENDPKNYNFILTDEYLKRIEAVGTKPFFRLGSSIEHLPIKRFIVPPKDFKKWGRICSKIIAHYNEGWADGFYMGIEYWEIWNEPDIPNCWTGTDEQIIALYEAAATVIKAEHPSVKVGGLAFSSTKCALVDSFLNHCKTNNVPLDFLSWHAYVRTPEEAAENAKRVREKMAEYGFQDKESVYDEWNYAMGWGPELEKSFDFHYTVGEAAFMGAMMSTASANGVDIACYYDVQQVMERVWNGVFAPGPRDGQAGKTVKTLPGYYALKYWGALYGKNVVPAACDNPTVYSTAAVSEDKKELYLLVSNFEDKAGCGLIPPNSVSLKFDVNGYCAKEAFVTDSYGNDARVSVANNELYMRGYTVALVVFAKN